MFIHVVLLALSSDFALGYKVLHSCDSNHTLEAFQSASLGGSCAPQPFLLPLPFPKDDLTVRRFFPSHVVVNRCGGSCAGLRSLHCLPSSTRMLKVTVLLAKCRTGQNDEDCSESTCAEIEVEDHQDCICGCRLNQEMCGDRKEFTEADCSCKCPRLEVDRCRQLYPKKEWREENCQCACHPKHFQNCDRGEVFDFNHSCRCQKRLDGNDSLLFERLAEVDDDDSSGLFSWELLVILLLSTLVFVLSTAVVVATKRIVVLNDNLNLQNTFLASAWNQHS